MIEQVSHMALVPELSHDEHVRVSLNSARYFFTISSNVLVFIFLWSVLASYCIASGALNLRACAQGVHSRVGHDQEPTVYVRGFAARLLAQLARVARSHRSWLAYVTLAVGLGTSIFFMVFTRCALSLNPPAHLHEGDVCG